MSFRTTSLVCLSVLCAAALSACGNAYPQNTWTSYYTAEHNSDNKHKDCKPDNTGHIVCKELTR